MKFKAKVAVMRDGRAVYYAPAAVALRMVLSGLALRRGQTMIELPGEGSPQDLDIFALERFDAAKPLRHCFGAHTSVNQDRMTYAPCFYRASTGQGSAARTVFMEGLDNEPHIPH